MRYQLPQKKIQFNKVYSWAGQTNNNPAAAAKAIPKWYRDLARYVGNKLATDGKGNTNGTIKTCPPFLDAMMSGYVIQTEFDLYVTKNDSGHYFEWSGGENLIATHHKEQLAPEQVPKGYSDQPYKFVNLWQVKTPKGYSSLFTHPINRYDLPFLTLAGIVETDAYENIVNFPFVIKDDFEGLIPAGTPIVQVIPIKREAWLSKLGNASAKSIENARIQLRHKMFGSYKSQWWQRKDYK